MAQKIYGFLPASAEMPSDRQRLFLRLLFGTLIDLVVLNLFAQYWDHVHIENFTISLFAAILLQILLKATIIVEHWVADFFKRKPGGFMVFLRFFFGWVVLFLSKFVILEALSFTFGDDVRFEGPIHGLVAIIAVAAAMIVAEELTVRIYNWLGGKREA